MYLKYAISAANKYAIPCCQEDGAHFNLLTYANIVTQIFLGSFWNSEKGITLKFKSSLKQNAVIL